MSVLRFRAIAALALAALILNLVLIQPNHPLALTWGALRLFPLELPVILLGLVAIPSGSRLTQVVRLGVVALLIAIVVLKLADYGMFVAFNRGFNPAVDLHLIAAGWNLGSGSIGVGLAALAILASMLVIAALAAALWWATGRWAAVGLTGRWQAGATVAALAAAIVAAGQIGQSMRYWRLPIDPPGAAFTARVALEHLQRFGRTRSDMAEFDRAALTDPYAREGRFFDRLNGHDVLFVYVESYGRASLEGPLYAPTHRDTLGKAETALRREGLDMRSAWLTAPMVGGQSWLAHATVATGLWVPDQTRYAAAIASSRQSIFHIARRSGFRTGAVMPAITLDWPESRNMGFDTILAARDLDYRGQSFNWITMPDQYTLAMLDRRLRDGTHDKPLFAQVALVSSHAPWVPVPDLVPWDAVGDGTVFDRWANSDDTPEVVWRDHDRVRDQYRKAVDYSLRTVGAYALKSAGDPPLMVVIGDHQAAPFVSQSSSADTPIHIIGPPDLIAQLDDWGWTPGLLPDADAPVLRMDLLRDRFIDAFSSPAPVLRAER